MKTAMGTVIVDSEQAGSFVYVLLLQTGIPIYIIFSIQLTFCLDSPYSEFVLNLKQEALSW